MPRETLSDLAAFLAVAREESFTRAAARLGVSQSALSHTVRGLETRLGVRLLNRTTRRVAPTEAGARLLATVGPRMDEIEAELAALVALGERPAGTIRVTASEHAAETVLAPALARFLPAWPEVSVEIAVDGALTDIVAERFDAGVRLGEQVARDMVAVPIGPDLRMVVVASPDYLARRGRPETPDDLTAHACINIRMATSGALYAWEFARDGRNVRVRVDGPLTVNTASLRLRAALDGLGLAFVWEDRAAPHVAAGRLEEVLADWTPPFPGYHLYFPSRRQQTPAFALLVDALRFRLPSHSSNER